MSHRHVALQHAEASLFVIAVRPSTKAARFTDWPNTRMTAEEVDAHWTRCPDDLVGILTGEPNGLIVLDKDRGSLSELEMIYGELPATLVVQTGGEGDHRHYYFRWPGFRCGNLTSPANRVHEGWDIKGDGGFVIAPGCRHPTTGREYGVVDAPDDSVRIDREAVAEAPGWLTRHLRTWLERQERKVHAVTDAAIALDLPEDQDAAEWEWRGRVSVIDPPTEGNGGDVQLFRICCELARCGVAPAEAADLLDEYDANECIPPFNDARRLSRKLAEAYRAVASEGMIGAYLRDEVPDDVDLSAGYCSPAGDSSEITTSSSAGLAQTGTDRIVPNDPVGVPLPESPPAAPQSADTLGDPLRSALRSPEQYAPFPLEVLPPLVREYCVSYAKARAIYPGAVAACLFPAFGAMIGTSRCSLDRVFRNPATFWVALVQRSGSGKSDAVKAGAKYNQKCDMRYRDSAKREHEIALNEWEANGSDRKSKPKPPKVRRCYAQDATTAAMHTILCDNPRGLLIFLDELAQLLAGMDQFKSKGGNDMEMYLELHGIASVTRDRQTSTNGDGPTAVYTPNTTVSFVGGIQPGRLRDLMGEKESASGFLQRWLPIQPPEATPEMIDVSVTATMPPHLTERMAGIFIQLEGLQPDRDGDRPVPREVTITPEAKDVWDRHWVALRKAAIVAPNDFQAAMLDKFILHTIRFALTLALVDEAERANDQGFGESSASTMQDVDIELRHIERAIVLAKWWQREASRVLDSIHLNSKDRAVQELLTLASKRGATEITARDLLRWDRKKYKTSTGAKLALVAVVKAGYAARVTEGVRKDSFVVTLASHEANGQSV